jgi:cysteine-rich repeat protein
MVLGPQRAIRGAFVALVASCACGASLPTYTGGGDAGGELGGDASGDVADTGLDLEQRLDLRIEVDCPDCNGYCGDGVLKAGELCDDGNKTPGDGCSVICQIPTGWICPVPGMPCQRTADQDAALD